MTYRGGDHGEEKEGEENGDGREDCSGNGEGGSIGLSLLDVGDNGLDVGLGLGGVRLGLQRQQTRQCTQLHPHTILYELLPTRHGSKTSHPGQQCFCRYLGFTLVTKSFSNEETDLVTIVMYLLHRHTSHGQSHVYAMRKWPHAKILPKKVPVNNSKLTSS